MKYLQILIFLLLSLPLYGQFRMVGNGSWATLTDSSYSATVTFQADLTGMGYLATQIVDTFRVFTGTEQNYRIASATNLTFSTADLIIVERNGDWGVPVGQVMVYDSNASGTIPQAPFGSTGSTAQLQAAVDSYNARLFLSGYLRNVVEDLTPQLGGSLDAQSNDINSVDAMDAQSVRLSSASNTVPMIEYDGVSTGASFLAQEDWETQFGVGQGILNYYRFANAGLGDGVRDDIIGGWSFNREPNSGAARISTTEGQYGEHFESNYFDVSIGKNTYERYAYFADTTGANAFRPWQFRVAKPDGTESYWTYMSDKFDWKDKATDSQQWQMDHAANVFRSFTQNQIRFEVNGYQPITQASSGGPIWGLIGLTATDDIQIGGAADGILLPDPVTVNAGGAGLTVNSVQLDNTATKLMALDGSDVVVYRDNITDWQSGANGYGLYRTGTEPNTQWSINSNTFNRDFNLYSGAPGMALYDTGTSWTSGQKTAFGNFDNEIGNFKVLGGTNGGLWISGYQNYTAANAGRGILMRAYGVNEGGASFGQFQLDAYRWDGSEAPGAATSFNDGTTLFAVANHTTQRLRLYGDGDLEISKNIYTGAGAVGDPAYGFTGDPNTGIYNPTGDQIALTLGGVQRMLFTASVATMREYDFDIDQTLGATEQDHALIYDDGDGQFSAEAIAPNIDIADLSSVTTGGHGTQDEVIVSDNGTEVRMTLHDAISMGTVTQTQTTTTLDFKNSLMGAIHVDLNSTASLTYTSVTGGMDGSTYVIRITEVNGSNTTITWPSNVYLEDDTLASAETYTTAQIIPITYDANNLRYYIPAGK